jgi:hypothetical protein
MRCEAKERERKRKRKIGKEKKNCGAHRLEGEWRASKKGGW